MRLLLTTAEVHAIYRIPPGTLRRWASEGRLVRYGTPARARYDTDEIHQLLDLLGREHAA